MGYFVLGLLGRKENNIGGKMRDIRNAELVLIRCKEDFEGLKNNWLDEHSDNHVEGTFSGFGYYAQFQYTRRDAACSCGSCRNYVNEYLPLDDYIKELEAEKAKLQELIDGAIQTSEDAEG